MPPKTLPYSNIVHWYSNYFFNPSSTILARAFYQENYEAGMHIHDSGGKATITSTTAAMK